MAPRPSSSGANRRPARGATDRPKRSASRAPAPRRSSTARSSSARTATPRPSAPPSVLEAELDLAQSTPEHAALELPSTLTPHAPDAAIRLGDVDEWGRSEHMRELARAVYDPIYRHWFRAEWEGLDKIPLDGPALLVANHAGAIPSDAPVIMHGIETELGRPVYGLADHFFRKAPVVGTLWSRLGGVAAHPDNAYRLLHNQRQLVLVFPEGTKGTSKLMGERYRLRRFGRGGFVEIAMRAGVPVIPIAVVGAEESMPIVARLPSAARALGVPYVPITANMLAFGPLGAGLYFPAKFRLRVLEPVHFDVPANRERYSQSRVMDESERIRTLIQDALFDMLAKRKSVWFG